ncbi:hypothetical protein OIO90_003187 [Microbotryomycetes sp. JL221]|nr:hypothetical protein OIO90_003187 [Microbotryomycetes sp. JL221]
MADDADMSTSSASPATQAAAAAASSTSDDRMLTINIKITTHPVWSVPLTKQVKLPAMTHNPTSTTNKEPSSSRATIGDVKRIMHREWPGKPLPEHTVCVKGGRVCRDPEQLEQVFSNEELDDENQAVLHVLFRPSAWSEPFPAATTEQNPTSSTNANDPATGPFTATNTSTSPSDPVLTSPIDASLAPPMTTAPSLPPIPLPSLPLQSPPPAPATAQTTAAASEPEVFAFQTASPATPTPAAPLSNTQDPFEMHSPNFAAFLANLHKLGPMQRTLLLVNLQKAQYHYSRQSQLRRQQLGWMAGTTSDPQQAQEGDNADVELDAVKELLIGCHLWHLVQQQEQQAQNDVKRWNEMARNVIPEWQVVQLHGMPYLLHTSRGVMPPLAPRVDLYQNLYRTEAILSAINSMLALVVAYQPSVAAVLSHSIARHQLYPAPTGFNPAPFAAAAAAAIPVPPTPELVPAPAGGPPPGQARDPVDIQAHFNHHAVLQHQQVRPQPPRRATLSIVINLEAILSVIVPLLLLSLKVGFLLWIFGRHASYNKRCVMGVMAGMWIVWEGWTMYRRRTLMVRLRQRMEANAVAELERARRFDANWNLDPARAHGGAPIHQRVGGVANPAQHVGADANVLRQRLNANAAANPFDLAGAPQGENGHQPGVGVQQPALANVGRHRRRREPLSRFSPRYWIARIATIGLVDEAHELGLAPRTLAGRTIQPPRGAGAGAAAAAALPTRTVRPPPLPHPQDRIGRARLARRRALRTFVVGIVLFFGTLIPEVERKRKRALEKRDRLLAERRVHREKMLEHKRKMMEERDKQLAQQDRQADTKQDAESASVDGREEEHDADDSDVGGIGQTQSMSEVSTPGLTYEVERDPLARAAEARAAAHRARGMVGGSRQVETGPSAAASSSSSKDRATSSSSSSTSTQREQSTDPIGGPASSSTTAPAGRAVVSDAELFADEGSSDGAAARMNVGRPNDEALGQDADIDSATEDRGGMTDELDSDIDDALHGRNNDDDDQVDQVVALF